MYLTKLTLNLRSAQARRDLGDAYEMHRTLVRAFASDPQDSPPRFLWRLEQTSDATQNPAVLTQSQTLADWSVLERLPNYLDCAAQTKLVNLAHLVCMDRRYRFRLLGNPTVKRQGKRLALLTQEEQIAWIERQGNNHGFRLLSLTIRPQELLQSNRAGQPPICVQRVCFEGFLVVCKTDAFEQALLAGIGPAKAFGCGLLSVAPC
jgi:CRISPR system Cascade subunit CasE